MLIETRIRYEDKKTGEATYIPALVNTDHVQSVFPAPGMDGVLMLITAAGQSQLVKDSLEKFTGVK
jgi:hypothetical protein